MERDELYREIRKTIQDFERIPKEEADAYEIELSLRSGHNPGYSFSDSSVEKE